MPCNNIQENLRHACLSLGADWQILLVGRRLLLDLRPLGPAPRPDFGIGTAIILVVLLTFLNKWYNSRMANIETAVREALEAAENRLRQLIVEAAKLGDYDAVDLARTVAGQVQTIADEHVSGRAEVSAELAANGDVPHDIRLASSVRRHRQRMRQYPRFYVEGGVLHKVGWSKKDREEYLHKIPKDVYDVIVRTISDVAQSGKKIFTSDQLVQRLQSQEPPVPVYQVYVTLALLRSRDIVEKKGREGYLTVSDVLSRGLRIWSELETKEGKCTR